MTHKPHHHFALKNATVTALVLGIAIISTSTDALLTAQLTEGGATMLHASAPMLQEATITTPLYGAAPLQTVDPSVQARLLIGMLMILLGFTLHLFNLRRMTQMHLEPVQAIQTKKMFQMKAWYLKYLDRHLGI